MSSLRKPLIVVLAGAAACAVASGTARAEVFALLNPDGSYQSTRIVRPEGAGSAWTSLGLAESRLLVLNPGGDRRGDGTPVLVTNPSTGLPFAAWSSRTSAGKHVIQVAAFDGREWVSFPPVGVGGGDDLEPDLVVLPGIIVAAWTHGRTNPSVWVSVHSSQLPEPNASSGWLAPIAIRPGERAHSPRLTFDRNRRLIVQSVGHGRPAIQDDPVTLPGVDATDGPMPIPPGMAPPTGDSGSSGGSPKGPGTTGQGGGGGGDHGR